MNYRDNYIELFEQIEELKLQFCNPYTIYPDGNFYKQDDVLSKNIFLKEHYNLKDLLANSDWLNKDINQILKSKQTIETEDNNPLGSAFSEKYESIDDARSLVQDWKSELLRAISHINHKTLSGAILHIGSDTHFEPQILHAKSKSITLADISKKLLNKATFASNPKNNYQTSAEQLTGIPNNSIDLYIALRVYCSANFNHEKAIDKAIEKLKAGGSILLSVSNGYRAIDDTILPGQIVDNPAKLSFSEPFGQAFEIILSMHLKGFKELFLVPGSSEIFLGGTYLPNYSRVDLTPILHLENINTVPLSFYSEKMPTAWLGNYSMHEIIIDGESWTTVEHYFQSKKFDNPIHKKTIQALSKPIDAKTYAWRFQNEVKENWHVERIGLMRTALSSKFSQHRQLSVALKNTYKRELIETSPTDEFWGRTISGSGQNVMGKLLSEIRNKIL